MHLPIVENSGLQDILICWRTLMLLLRFQRVNYACMCLIACSTWRCSTPNTAPKCNHRKIWRLVEEKSNLFGKLLSWRSKHKTESMCSLAEWSQRKLKKTFWADRHRNIRMLLIFAMLWPRIAKKGEEWKKAVNHEFSKRTTDGQPKK